MSPGSETNKQSDNRLFPWRILGGIGMSSVSSVTVSGNALTLVEGLL